MVAWATRATSRSSTSTATIAAIASPRAARKSRSGRWRGSCSAIWGRRNDDGTLGMPSPRIVPVKAGRDDIDKTEPVLLRRLLQVSDEIGAVAGARQAGIGHAVGGDKGLRVGEILVERLCRPAHAAAFHRGRIAEIPELAGLAREQPMQTRPHFIGAGVEFMAGRAFLETCLAAYGIALGVDNGDESCGHQSGSYNNSYDHAYTSGPGFFR